MNLKPNCRKGDVVMFKRDAFGTFGGAKFTMPRGTFSFVLGLDWKESMFRRAWHWHIEPSRLPSQDGLCIGLVTGASDDVLKPIRPGDGEDEILRIAGKPVHRPTIARQSEHSR